MNNANFSRRNSTKIFMIALFSIVFFLSIIAILFQPISKVKAANIEKASLFAPTEYMRFYGLRDVCVDKKSTDEYLNGGKTYVLDKAAQENQYRILVFGSSLMPETIELNTLATNPTKITVNATHIFIYDTQAKKIFYSEKDNINFVQFTNSTFETFKDFESNNSSLFILTQNSLTSINILAPTNTATTIANIENAKGFLNLYKNTSGAFLSYYDDKIDGIDDDGIYTVKIDGTHQSFFKLDEPQTAVCFELEGKTFYYVAYNDKLKIINHSGQSVTKNFSNSIEQGEFGYITTMYISMYQSDINKFELTAIDNKNATLQTFLLDSTSGSMSIKTNSYKSSKGTANGKFFSPNDIFERDGFIYVLDSANKRIQKFAKENNNAKYVSQINLAEDNASNLAVDISNNIFYSSGNKTYKIDAKLNKTEYVFSSPIVSLGVDLRHNVYALTSSKAYIIQNNQTTPIELLTNLNNANGIAVNQNNDIIFISENNTIKFFNAKTGALINSITTQDSIVDIDIDFDDNLIALTNNFSVLKLSLTNDKTAFSDETQTVLISNSLTYGEQNISLESIAKLSLNLSNGEIILCHKNSHFISTINSNVLNITTPTQIPEVEPPVNIFENANTFGNEKMAIIKSYPSTCIYPVHENYKNHTNFPKNLNKTEMQILEPETTVLILAETEKYYYVLHSKQVGFILKNSVEIPTSQVPTFTDGIILHEKVTVFKYPSTLMKNSSVVRPEYYFALETLDKNTQVTIVDKMCDYRDSNNVIWYKISYGENNNVGYVARESISKNIAEQPNKNLPKRKVVADIANGTVDIYDDIGDGSTAITQVKDGTYVYVLDVSNEHWFYVKGVDMNGNDFAGYINTSKLKSYGLTTSQIVGICGISAVLVCGIVALIVVVCVKKNKKKKEQANLTPIE